MKMVNTTTQCRRKMVESDVVWEKLNCGCCGSVLGLGSGFDSSQR